jgi:hypothetical protein
MSNIIKIFTVILLLTFIQLPNIYAGNENWKSFMFDDEYWDFGPPAKILIHNNEIYVSGAYGMRSYDSLIFNGIARIQDSLLLPLGSGDTAGVRGFFPVVGDIIKKDSLLYVCGLFDSAGSKAVSNIAVWNSNTGYWSDFGSIINGMVYKMAFIGNRLYVTGGFDTLIAGGDTTMVKNIACWDGTQWNALGGGLNRPPNDIYVSGRSLYVVGDFDSVGTTPYKHIAIWNDSTQTWSGFGTNGPTGEIITVCKIGNSVYFGGMYDSVYTGSSYIRCNNICKWNGSAWDSLAGGVEDVDYGFATWGTVDDMITDGSNLYVGGEFTKTIQDSLVCKNIAKWNGSSWEIFGTGTDGTVKTIALKGDSVLIGGEFIETGDTLAYNMGLWFPYQAPQPKLNGLENNNDELAIKIYPNPVNRETAIEFYNKEKGDLELSITDILGQGIKVIAEGNYSAGWHKVYWTTGSYASGTYILKLTGNGKSINTNIVINK